MMSALPSKDKLMGVVVIGRNEGERLITCLESVCEQSNYIVYVDSGSTDKSIDEALSKGVDALSLDMSISFTAARARNVGAKHLIAHYPQIQFIQFIDGDCELQASWLNNGLSFMNEHQQYAVVCGRLRERFPERSIYNKLMDIEWDTAVGDVKACGGIAMMRVDAFTSVNGFNEDLIAGEEPELCFRLRQRHWKVYRLKDEMALHDAAMLRFSQWWMRMVRGGYAFTLGSSIHGQSKERYWVKETQRIIFWGLFLPVIILLIAMINPLLSFLYLIYFAQIVKVGLNRRKLGKLKFKWAASVVLGKIPEAVGLLKFYCSGKTTKIIEYK